MPHRELPDASLSFIGNALLPYLRADAVPASSAGRYSPSLMHNLGFCSACTVIKSRTPPCLGFVFLLAAVCCTRCTGQPTMCCNTTGSSRALQCAALNSPQRFASQDPSCCTGQPTVGCNGTAGASATVKYAPAGGSITLFAEEFLCPGVDLGVRIQGSRGSRGQVRAGLFTMPNVLSSLRPDILQHAMDIEICPQSDLDICLTCSCCGSAAKLGWLSSYARALAGPAI